ncbi:sensor histidine kinase [Aureivirga marina]|uniref:sensor histidine kinase n=1 Tax=Aureivirga marina TaxID=1182451 RepID=UPI0018CB4414|nr:HAMP domain-containing sensor histidine kinase [Aureivirga marina]
MKKKLQILIIVSIIVFLSLSIIQYSLIKNTFNLEQKIFKSEIEKIMTKINKAKSLENFEERWKRKFSFYSEKYQIGKFSKEEYLDSLYQFTTKENKVFVKLFDQEKKKINLDYDIDFQMKPTLLIFIHPEKKDSIWFPEKFHIGNSFIAKNALIVNNSIWKVETSSDETDIENNKVSYELFTADYVKIKNKTWIIFQRMSFTFFFSILLFILICSLFFYTVKSMIKQKDLLLLKTDFINNIIHEFKTPLATLKIASKSLRNKKIVTNEILLENTLTTIERQNIRLEKLLNQIVEISPNNQIKLQFEKVEMSNFLKEIYQDFQLSCSQKEINFLENISDEKVNCSIDKVHLTIAIQNLLDNAIKYSKDEIKVEVNSYVKDNFYHIKIKDSGIGISSKKQKEIFKKFYRVASGNIHNVKGLGLGLFYTKQIIEQHHGEIFVKSELGKGTVFNIKLPIENEK